MPSYSSLTLQHACVVWELRFTIRPSSDHPLLCAQRLRQQCNLNSGLASRNHVQGKLPGHRGRATHLQRNPPQLSSRRQPWPGKKRTESQLSEPSPAASPLRPQFLRVASQTVTETTTEFKQAETSWEAEEDILPDDSAQPHESASDTPSPTRKPAPHTFRLQSCGKSSRTSRPASELCWRNKASSKALIATQPGLIKRQLEVIE